jgi:hypothetical protein
MDVEGSLQQHTELLQYKVALSAQINLTGSLLEFMPGGVRG